MQFTTQRCFRRRLDGLVTEAGVSPYSRKYLANTAHICVVVRSVDAGLTAGSGLPLLGRSVPHDDLLVSHDWLDCSHLLARCLSKPRWVLIHTELGNHHICCQSIDWLPRHQFARLYRSLHLSFLIVSRGSRYRLAYIHSAPSGNVVFGYVMFGDSDGLLGLVSVSFDIWVGLSTCSSA